MNVCDIIVMKAMSPLLQFGSADSTMVAGLIRQHIHDASPNTDKR